MGNKPIQITENLFIGSIGSASHRDNLLEAGITHIVCCFDKDFRPFEKDFCYLHVAVMDSVNQDLKQHFDETNKFIDQAIKKNSKNKILVHCFAGISRSSTVLSAYLMHSQKIEFDKALLQIRKTR